MSLAAPGPASPPVERLYGYDCSFCGVAGTDLATGDLPELTWANLTLEAYGVQTRDQYPAAVSTTYGAINLVAGAGLVSVPWAPVVRTGAFGESATPVHDAVPAGQVDIGY
jgi:hypothetical protein